MTSKIIVNTIEADTGISSVTFASNINLQNDSSVLVSSSGVRLGTGSTIAAPSANEITLSTNSAERLRLTSGGNIGIGTISPGLPLDVVSNTSSETVRFRGASGGTGTLRFTSIDGGTNYSFIQSRSTFFDLGTDASIPLKFSTAGSERLRILSDGKVIIGATSAGGLFSVHQSANSANYINITNGVTGSSSWSNGMLLGPNSSGDALVWQNENLDLRFGTNNLDRMRITSAGRVGINQSTPQTTFHSTGTTNGQQATFGIDDSGLKISTFQKTDNDAGVILDAQKSSNGTLTFATAGTERFRITSAGKIGFNATNPPRDYCFHSGQADTNIQITNNTTGIDDSAGSLIQQDGNDLYIWNKENSFMSLGTNAAERVRITNAGYVLKSDTPAFNCKLSTATASTFTGTLVFNAVSYNIGNNYSSSNGRFTAPVDGRYLFAFYTNVEKGGSAGVVWGDWYVNGNARGNRFYTRWDGNWELVGGTIILDLNTNDYVTVNATTAGKWDGGSYGSYSGYLLG